MLSAVSYEFRRQVAMAMLYRQADAAIAVEKCVALLLTVCDPVIITRLGALVMQSGPVSCLMQGRRYFIHATWMYVTVLL